jgi:hypothetical protein
MTVAMGLVVVVSDDKNMPQNMSQLFAHFMNEPRLNVVTICKSLADTG